MKRTWLYLQNVFANVTANSFVKFMKISLYHFNAITAKAGDPFFDTLIANYNLAHKNYLTLYNKWTASEGTHKGSTGLFDSLLQTLSITNIEDWDIKIQNIYKKGTPKYVALLPHGRKPFQSGAKDDRVIAVSNLITAIGTDASLVAVKALVQAVSDSLVAARSVQQGTIGGTNHFSDDLELARLVAAKLMYKNLGLLIANFFEAPESASAYFDLETIRHAEQAEFLGHVSAHDDHFIAKRTLQPDDVIRLINTGTVPLVFRLADEKNDGAGSPSITVNAGEEEHVKA